MNKNEQKLFLMLSNFKNRDGNGILKLIEKGCANAVVLGTLFENRMSAAAYNTLKDNGLLGKASREFRNSLKHSALYNEKLNEDFLGCVSYIGEQLSFCGVPYALLKGAYLCGKYPAGIRTSNDIDVLLMPSDVGRVGAKLKAAGFRQGYIINDTFIPATREEIISSKMSRGETVPYIKEIKLPFIKHLEVDLNFSLDYKNSGSDAVEKMLTRAVTKQAGKTAYKTLDGYDFFLHLCCHLHKEASTYPWIAMKRDMTLYKYLDIAYLAEEMSDDEINVLIQRAKENYMCDELGFALHCAAEIFGKGKQIKSALSQLEFDRDVLNTVLSPSEHKKFIYTERDIANRFFAEDRRKLLSEVVYEEA